MKKSRRRIYYALGFILGIILIASLLVYFSQQGIVSAQQFESYARTLVSDYNRSLSFFSPDTFEGFDFYSNTSYDVTAFYSTDYGAAILFNCSEVWSFHCVNSSQRVEDMIFGPINSLELTKFNFVGDNTGIISAKNGNNSVVDIGIFVASGSNVLFKSITINSVYYDCLIVKGANQSSYWDSTSAAKDAQRIFDADLCYALGRSEEVRERYAEPDLNAMLLRILTKWRQSVQNGNVTYTYTQKECDLRQIEELAKTKYGITNPEFVNDLLSYLQNVTLPPTKKIFGVTVDDPSNWLYVTVLTILSVVIYITYLFYGYIRRKRPESDLKYLPEAVGGLLAIGLGDLIYVLPYDYQLFSIQTVVLILAVIIGVAIVYTTKRKLIAWRTTAKDNDHNDVVQNAKTKPEKTADSKKVKQKEPNDKSRDKSKPRDKLK